MSYVTKAKVLIERKLRDELARFLAKLTVKEIAHILGRVEKKHKLEIFSHVSQDKKPHVLLMLSEGDRKYILKHLSDKEIASIISDLASDDACRILKTVGEERADFILSYLSAQKQKALSKQMRYSKEVAGGIMQKEMIVARENEKVKDVIDKISKAGEQFWLYDIYVVDDNHSLIGRVPIERLIRSEKNSRIADIMDANPLHVSVMDDRENVVKIFKDRKIYSLPVVDRGKLAGVITIDEALRIMEEEHTEDLFKMFSLEKDEHIFDPLKKSLRNRGVWLLINLFTAFLAASVVGLFEDVLKSFVLFAVFMPIVAGEGGNATTQTMAVVVRSLALREISAGDFIRVVRKELTLALINGLIVGSVAGFFAVLWKGSILIAVALFLAMIINLIVAALAGAIIPLILDRIGSDPASSSTVILTTLTDVFGFMSFLGIGALLLDAFGVI